jgi:hypothetical protein
VHVTWLVRQLIGRFFQEFSPTSRFEVRIVVGVFVLAFVTLLLLYIFVRQ